MQVLLVDVWVSVNDFREYWVDASVISLCVVECVNNFRE